MLHIVLEHNPAIEDQRIIDEGFLTAQAERMGDPHLDVFACFPRRAPTHPGRFAGVVVVALAVRRAAVGDARPARSRPWTPPNSQ